VNARSVVLLVASSSLLVIACRPRAKVGDGPYADKVAADVPMIEQAIGVKFKTPPRLELRTRDQVRELLLQKMREPDVQRDLQHQEITYKLLGMLPDTLHLADLFVKVLTEQILGYYDPKTKILYVVQGAPDDYVGITIMHELVHALQDQYINLDSLEHLTGDDDRAAAVQAVVEGEATYEQVYIMAGGSGNLIAQLPGGWESMRETIREAQTTQPIFSSAPMVIQETLLFPYINGSEFVRRFKSARKGQFPLTDLPVSTEQIMHDSAYFAARRDVPSTIQLPRIAGTVDENDFGEFGTRLFLYQHLRDQDRAIRAATGWDGDRYALVKMSGGYGFAWVTVWDSRVDAAEFMSAIDGVVEDRFHVKPTVTGERRRYEANARTIVVNVKDVGGRPVVLYVDVPTGASTGIVDLGAVKVTPR
jgi:hypothetical protein